MATKAQKTAARKNIKKAQKAWQSLSPRARARRQPQGRGRTKPGAGGSGTFYHIEVRPKEQFTSFRTQDIGRTGHTERVAGRRSSGSWATAKVLVAKTDAHVVGNKLVIDKPKAKQAVAGMTRGPITHVKGDVFRALPRKNVPEKAKPTPAMRRAQKTNIKKAQAARQRSKK